MKTYSVLTASLCAVLLAATPCQGQSMLDRLKAAAKAKADAHENDAANSTVNKADSTATGAVKTAVDPNAPAPAAGASAAAGAAPAAAAGAAPAAGAAAATANVPTVVSIAAYQNYDFVPGDSVVFYDDFTTTQDGEFPDQWGLEAGQGVVNNAAGSQAFALTDGNYVRVSPRVKGTSYLGPQYTIEYDTYNDGGAYPLLVFFNKGTDRLATLSIAGGGTEYTADGVRLGGALPPAVGGDKYNKGWRHIALAVKNNQLKAYVDQYRVLVVPDMKVTPTNIELGGIGDQTHPIVFRNFRIASGGSMNMLGQKFTDAKIVTHGINFDIDKATLRPESMGTLNQIKRILTDNPDLKFEIDGHTDNTGTSPHNLTLSQQRADAVKAQLVSMGIDPARLTTKGFGDTKPMTTNDTPDGKANNRRVEFVRAT